MLNNSYKPGLVTNQFNCIISNPPWLAMSKLADNPYKKTLQEKTNLFGIKPPGASHLHMELATTFLLASVDRYLKDGARWMMVMPGSLLSGYHHDPIRLERYKSVLKPVAVKVDTIWELPMATFKNKAIVLGGEKSKDSTQYPLAGRVYDEQDHYIDCDYTLARQGNRSAWTNRGNDTEIIDALSFEPWPFYEGADIMPRSALFHECQKLPNGTWNIRRIGPESKLRYLLSDSHDDTCIEMEADGFSDEYMFDCLISKHLSPFVVSAPVKTIVPGKRTGGKWKGLLDSDIALMNIGTSYVFNEIQEKGAMPLGKRFERKINIRNKLDKQDFSWKRWLVLSNAGGKNPCAAYLDLQGINRTKLIIDQTLYWYLTDSEEEAIYLVGILNSLALAETIIDFQPQGGFGQRHIHTIPYKLIPHYDSEDDAHLDVVMKTKLLMEEWKDFCSKSVAGKYIAPDSGSLSSRRRKLQKALRNIKSYPDYEKSCRIVMCMDEV